MYNPFDPINIPRSWDHKFPLHIWVDDERFPPTDMTVWFKKDFSTFESYITAHAECLEGISFDHDLGHDANGHDLISIMERMVLQDGVKFPNLKRITIHTGNTARVRDMMAAACHISDASPHRPDPKRFFHEWWSDAYRDLHGEDALTALRHREFPAQVF